MQSALATPNPAPASHEIVRLNVGGTRFYTTRQTLLASSHNPNFFHGLLSGRMSTAMDETGAYFIDRDPEHFPAVLNYLRTNNWEGSKKALEEAKFYGVEVTLMTSVTDANLCSLARTAMLEEVAKDHERIAAFVELISPVLVARVRRNTKPSISVHILVVLPSDDQRTRDTVTRMQSCYGAPPNLLGRYHTFVENSGDNQIALVASSSVYDLLASSVRYPALRVHQGVLQALNCLLAESLLVSAATSWFGSGDS